MYETMIDSTSSSNVLWLRVEGYCELSSVQVSPWLLSLPNLRAGDYGRVYRALRVSSYVKTKVSVGILA